MTLRRPLFSAGIGARITLIAVLPMLIALGVILATLVIEQRQLQREVHATVEQQSLNEAAKIARSVYLLCSASDSRNRKELAHSLSVARTLVERAGGFRLAEQSVEWEAINQLTKAAVTVSLPKVLAGKDWLGQIAAAKDPAPIVDEARRLTGAFCTIFQRINEAGDMLRVATSVLKDDRTRAIGTFIPAVGPDGTAGPVIQAVLRGETYLGRAFVVNDWHATAYEPIWDADRKRVIGMLFVGIGMGAINRELQASISQMTVGKTGYVFVLGGKGDQRGKYVVSAKGQRDGENIWDAKDASGRLFIQSIIGKGLTVKDGSIEFEHYPWQNRDETIPRMKYCAITYFAPWDWVIGASAYEDDFAEARGHLDHAQSTMIKWITGISLAMLLIAGVGGHFFARSIVRPILRIMESLNASSAQLTLASGQVSSASQSLADGSSAQAASLEETGASLSEMASMTGRNAEHATRANELTRQARHAADSGGGEMRAMDTAMADIKASSDDIAKIIKTIDEIAFQTNILALNAAVEAARAGTAGAGFSVVAEEVRRLAQRSASAAKETADKIEGAIAKTAQGVQISSKVGASLNEIVEKVRQVDQLVADVANASREQSQGVQQINQAVGKMDQIVQANAANAAESSNAAVQLTAQADALNQAVIELSRLVGARHGEARTSQLAAGAPIADLVTWDAIRMSSGIESVDAQHRELIAMINRLHRACLTHQGRAEVRAMLDQLSQYVVSHFQHEEEKMTRHQCPAHSRNKAAHEKFLGTFRQISNRFDSEGDSMAILLDLRRLVAEWLENHICHVDIHLRGCAASPGHDRPESALPSDRAGPVVPR